MEFGTDHQKIVFYHLLNFGVPPKMDNPTTYAEKMSWLKLNHTNPLIPFCSDKIRVREYLNYKNLAHLEVPLAAVYDSPEELNPADLPDSFVAKSNHGSSFFQICPDKSKVDFRRLKKEMATWLRYDFSRWFAETNYRGIVPKILVEPHVDPDGVMVEYKFYCFHGEPKYVVVIGSRVKGAPVRRVFDMNWKPMEFGSRGVLWDPVERPRPDFFPEMIDCSRRMSEAFIHVRVDFLAVEQRIYFSELTFTSMGGFALMEPLESNDMVGSWIDLEREPEYSVRGRKIWEEINTSAC